MGILPRLVLYVFITLGIINRLVEMGRSTPVYLGKVIPMGVTVAKCLAWLLGLGLIPMWVHLGLYFIEYACFFSAWMGFL